MVSLTSPRLLKFIELNDLVDDLTDKHIAENFDLSLCYELLDALESDDLIAEGYDVDFCLFLIALSRNSSESIVAFRFLQLAAESLNYVYGENRTFPYFRELTKATLERIKQCDENTLNEKISIFKEMYDDDLHWDRPFCAVILALKWDLTPTSMDECIESYLNIRNESEDAWSEEYDSYHYGNWMPLLGLAVLKSSLSDRELDAVDLTSRTPSALPLWAWLSIFQKVASAGSTEGSQLDEWYPELFWRESVFLDEEINVEFNQKNWLTLLTTYFENQEIWLWSYDWVNVDKENLDNYFQSFL